MPSVISLPSAGRWQRIFAICQRTAKRCHRMPIYCNGPTPLFAICWRTAKILCHLLADGKEGAIFFLRVKKPLLDLLYPYPLSLRPTPLSLPLVSPSPSREKLRRPIPASSGGIRRRPPHSREPPDPAPLRHLASARRCALPPHHFPSPLSPSLRSAAAASSAKPAASFAKPAAPKVRSSASLPLPSAAPILCFFCFLV